MIGDPSGKTAERTLQSADQVMANAEAIGAQLARFLDFAAQEANGVPIADWIARDYTPERLKAWLDAHGMSGSYAAIFTRPTRSPFQW